MAITTVWIDDGVKEETTRIASQLGLTFNGVVNIRFYNKCWGSEAERPSYTQHLL